MTWRYTVSAQTVSGGRRSRRSSRRLRSCMNPTMWFVLQLLAATPVVRQPTNTDKAPFGIMHVWLLEFRWSNHCVALGMTCKGGVHHLTVGIVVSNRVETFLVALVNTYWYSTTLMEVALLLCCLANIGVYHGDFLCPATRIALAKGGA